MTAPGTVVIHSGAARLDWASPDGAATRSGMSVLARLRAFAAPAREERRAGSSAVYSTILALAIGATVVLTVATVYFPIHNIAAAPGSSLQTAAAVFGLAIWTALHARAMLGAWYAPFSDIRAVEIAAETVLALALMAAFGEEWLGLAWMTLAMGLLNLGRRNQIIAIVATLPVYAALALAVTTPTDRNELWFRLPGSILAYWLLPRLALLTREFMETRSQLAFAAMSEQRLRVARDLHDTLGRTMSAALLKTELAGRQLDRGVPAARQQILEASELLRSGMAEMQQVVAGMRQPSLRQEIDSACEILRAAGIHATADIHEDATTRLDRTTSGALGWVVREGVTNVLKHSDAAACSIRLTDESSTVTLTVDNDGLAISRRGVPSGGNGMAGLRERMEPVGGTVDSGPLDAGGYRLVARVPKP